MENFIRTVLISLMLLLGRTATAGCEFYPGHSMTALKIDIPPTLSIPRDTPNGTVIYESPPLVIGTISSSYKCTSTEPAGVRNNVGQLGGIPSDSYTLPIGTTGLGWRWKQGGYSNAAYPSGGSPIGGTGFNGVRNTIEIVKFADVTKTQKIPSGVLGYIQVGEVVPLSMSTGGMTIVAQSCETPDVKVNMGAYNLSQFSEIGKHSDPVIFNIKVNNCPRGINKVTYTLSPTPSSPIVNLGSGTIGLNASSTAKGIALQLLDSDLTPVTFNKAYTVSDYSAVGGNFSIPLNAQFIRTVPTGKNGALDAGMSSGTANAEVWFIMNYL
ncbi:fimbrial protein [Pseudomonas protegens]|uniref:fimbrial protein n=1 Tax=Pseudomonas protegens TaxID=380021 RepID=UPI0016172A67|nr:fimbrial protein [Pseudomonas protegens]